MLFLDRKQSHAENLSQSALRRLSQADPALGSLIRQIGPCRLGRAGRNNHFAALVEAIIYQQLAGKAAAVIFSRFRALYSSRRFPTPEKLDRTPDRTPEILFDSGRTAVQPSTMYGTPSKPCGPAHNSSMLH